ncbi:YtxH domain-containing protein [Candidatus Poribacteria bacterium]|nr:YtxH domain-containing protein [Candidatus Poribacteria bacterium]
MSNNEQNNNEEKNSLAAILVFFTGFIAGAAIGLLCAPNSGAKTRAQIRQTSTDIKNQTVEFAQQTIGAVKENVQTLGTR